ncbi:very short patch repair endonuclease [Paenibacillus lactis]|uniref:very short patch repair endonuclease n=1 Tax=Paenibacillus lactis TaxID=228574 RepID=UPI00048EEFA6|nr:very short patch repair endonuclease [Paenibacillus lactis]MCM3494728.1 very short patch repair endonuclease [Paenibacillus lactis]GIO91411.1 very short patch repair endonuclease [Paenibacillus lactis]
MTDNLSPEIRSKNMRAIRSKGTKLEDKVSKELWKRGYRFRRNSKDLFGKPDLSIKKYRIAIFLDSCYWHGCIYHGNSPKSNMDYWIKKLNRNKERDLQVTNYYKNNDWSILRVWEHQLKKDTFDQTIQEICNFIDQAKNKIKAKN